MAISPYALDAGCRPDFFCSQNYRQLESCNNNSERDQRHSNHQIRQLYSRGLMQAVVMQLLERHASNLIDGLGRATQNQQATRERPDCSAQRIECLRKIQTARRRLWRPEYSNVGISRYLKRSNSGGKHHQRHEKKWEGWSA